MANQLNPFTAPLSAIKQMGEQANVAIQSLGTGMTRATSQTLDALMGGLPGLPGMPPGAPAPAMNTGLPTPGGLMPANLTQALSQVENLLIPPGLPRPSQVLAGVTPTPTPPPEERPPAPANAQAIAQRRRVQERRGM
ncbi:MAG: hypothetical protein GH143_07275 [Calditrichaeota bacterium]|nr:hypothetical protein [Calditrichota bacterium]